MLYFSKYLLIVNLTYSKNLHKIEGFLNQALTDCSLINHSIISAVSNTSWLLFTNMQCLVGKTTLPVEVARRGIQLPQLPTEP